MFSRCLKVHLFVFGFFLGVLLGRLRVPHQPHPPSRSGSDADGPILSPHLCGLLHSLLPGHHPVHADFLCWFPGKMVKVFDHINHSGFGTLRDKCLDEGG